MCATGVELWLCRERAQGCCGTRNGKNLVADLADFATHDRGCIFNGDTASVGGATEGADVTGNGVGIGPAGFLSGEEGREALASDVVESSSAAEEESEDE